MKAAKKYLITFAAGFAGVLYILWMKDFFNQTEMATIFHILCDAFFVVGVVITGIGLLIFTTNEGVFDGMVFAVKSFVNMFRRQAVKKYESYYDYRAARADKKVTFGFMLICGVFFIAVSFVMLYLNKLYL